MNAVTSRPRWAAALALLAALSLVGACGSSGSGTAPAGGGAELTGTVVVSAAASLTGAFDQIKADFTTLHPGVTVTISYGGSDTLAAQINQGAPVDVFASASDKTMALVVDAGSASGPAARFATNTLEIAVPKDNPARITGLADLARAGVKVALCAPTVPCGAASTKVLDAARLTVTPVTQEQDVKSVLTKVQLGEVDAGLVYRTDVLAGGGRITGIAFPEAAGAVTSYPIVMIAQAPNPVAAQALVDYVLSAAGQRVLAAAGFAAP